MKEQSDDLSGDAGDGACATWWRVYAHKVGERHATLPGFAAYLVVMAGAPLTSTHIDAAELDARVDVVTPVVDDLLAALNAGAISEEEAQGAGMHRVRITLPLLLDILSLPRGVARAHEHTGDSGEITMDDL